MESLEKFNIRTLEIAGFVGVLNALRLPFGKECRSECNYSYSLDENLRFCAHTECFIHEKDIQLMSTLVKRGDEHSKCTRGIQVWVEIDAPLLFWNEMTTYRIGAEGLSSTSSMHIEGKGLSTEELVKMKEDMPMGHFQKRVLVLSYQALRRIYKQRRGHRLPHWKKVLAWIESLPFADELILVGLEREDYGTE